MKSKVFLNEWTIRVHLFCDLCKIMNNTYFYKVAGCMSLILFFLKFCECFFPYENFEGNRIFHLGTFSRIEKNAIHRNLLEIIGK